MWARNQVRLRPTLFQSVLFFFFLAFIWWNCLIFLKGPKLTSTLLFHVWPVTRVFKRHWPNTLSLGVFPLVSGHFFSSWMPLVNLLKYLPRGVSVAHTRTTGIHSGLGPVSFPSPSSCFPSIYTVWYQITAKRQKRNPFKNPLLHVNLFNAHKYVSWKFILTLLLPEGILFFLSFINVFYSLVRLLQCKQPRVQDWDLWIIQFSASWPGLTSLWSWVNVAFTTTTAETVVTSYFTLHKGFHNGSGFNLNEQEHGVSCSVFGNSEALGFCCSAQSLNV